MANLGPQNGAKMGPQNAPKSKTKLNTKNIRVKTVLGASWADLGPFSVPSWGAKTFKNHWFSLVFLKISFLEKITVQEPSWTELGANLGAQEAQNGAQEAPKTGPKIDQKNDQILNDF